MREGSRGSHKILLSLLVPSPTPNTRAGSIDQKAWSGARNPRMWFPSMGGFRSPDDKHNTGLGIVCLPAFTLLQKSTQLFHSDSGQPYAKCFMLKKYMH